jgi:NAD(P)-dependent dehydrogenase (short-subunit alcohol dehydrogenase family)
MRKPDPSVLPVSDRMHIVALDVTKSESIAAALEVAGPLDALVNNAGVGVMGALEATPMSKVRQVFETNTLGVIAMSQAVTPQFRLQRSGVIVNVTSSVTLTPMPLAAVYTGSKMAIEGFTASLEHEMAVFGVRVKLVEPGYGPGTNFTANTGISLDDTIPEPYRAFAEPIVEVFVNPGMTTTAQDVAQVVFRAANDASGQLRFAAGPDAVALAEQARSR